MKNKGFTILEMMIAASIFLILMAAIFMMMDVGRGSWFIGDASVELRQEIIKAFMTMERELRETGQSQINLAGGSSSPTLTFRLPQDNNGDGTILDAAGEVEWSGPVTYALNGSNQVTRTMGGQTTILANNIVNLQFSRPLSPVDILQIDITARKTTATRRQIQEDDQIIIKMRN